MFLCPQAEDWKVNPALNSSFQSNFQSFQNYKVATLLSPTQVVCGTVIYNNSWDTKFAAKTVEKLCINTLFVQKHQATADLCMGFKGQGLFPCRAVSCSFKIQSHRCKDWTNPEL